jgi:hypothetical protein
MDNGESIKARLLFSLARKRKWGESHTAFENMFKTFRTEAFGKAGMKRVRTVADKLMHDGFIIKKPTHYGLHVSLNPRMSQEIKMIIKKHLGYDL